ncbi:hypothetical protein KAI87_08890 [Myxococcota bacterium]|nr:hypothetical protein [Myxococcota bacterium]
MSAKLRLITALSSLVFMSCAAPLDLVKVGGPAPTKLSADVTFQNYLSAQPKTFKIRHQVESVFMGRTEVISGFLVGDERGRLRVHARKAIGPPLFDIISDGDENPPLLEAHLPGVDIKEMATHLIADIRRIYMTQCPATTRAVWDGDIIRVDCPLPASGFFHGDDRLVMSLSRGGVVAQKLYYRQGEQSLIVKYQNYKEIDGRWQAEIIEAEPTRFPYRLRIALQSAKFNTDVSHAFVKPTAP